MPYGTITVGSDSYASRSPGVYAKSTVSFGDPANEFRIRGASLGKDGLLRASIVRLLQKDVTTGSGTVRKAANVTITIAVPTSGFTSAELDNLALDISTFLTTDTITRLLQGES